MAHMRIGILHPDEMGASVGAAARESGATVSWASVGRSDASRRRAAEAGPELSEVIDAVLNPGT